MISTIQICDFSPKRTRVFGERMEGNTINRSEKYLWNFLANSAVKVWMDIAYFEKNDRKDGL